MVLLADLTLHPLGGDLHGDAADLVLDLVHGLIAQERKKAVNEAKDEIGGMAMEIASKVVEREIKEADHKDLIDEFIKNVGEAS